MSSQRNVRKSFKLFKFSIYFHTERNSVDRLRLHIILADWQFLSFLFFNLTLQSVMLYILYTQMQTRPLGIYCQQNLDLAHVYLEIFHYLCCYFIECVVTLHFILYCLFQFLQLNYRFVIRILESAITNIRAKDELATIIVSVLQKVGSAKDFLVDIVMDDVKSQGACIECTVDSSLQVSYCYIVILFHVYFIVYSIFIQYSFTNMRLLPATLCDGISNCAVVVTMRRSIHHRKTTVSFGSIILYEFFF